jgi:hypothetical protein
VYDANEGRNSLPSTSSLRARVQAQTTLRNDAEKAVNLTDKQNIEKEMYWDLGLLEGGFYQHYPLSPTPLGRFILEQYNKRIE